MVLLATFDDVEREGGRCGESQPNELRSGLI